MWILPVPAGTEAYESQARGMTVLNFHSATGRIVKSNCLPLEAPDAHLLPVADLEPTPGI